MISKYIKLTKIGDSNNREILINNFMIVSMEPLETMTGETYTSIGLFNGEHVSVNETPAEIQKLIKDSEKITLINS